MGEIVWPRLNQPTQRLYFWHLSHLSTLLPVSPQFTPQNLTYQSAYKSSYSQLTGFLSRAGQHNYAREGCKGHCEARAMTAREVLEDIPLSKEETEQVDAEMSGHTQHSWACLLMAPGDIRKPILVTVTVLCWRMLAYILAVIPLKMVTVLRFECLRRDKK